MGQYILLYSVDLPARWIYLGVVIGVKTFELIGVIGADGLPKECHGDILRQRSFSIFDIDYSFVLTDIEAMLYLEYK